MYWSSIDDREIVNEEKISLKKQYLITTAVNKPNNPTDEIRKTSSKEFMDGINFPLREIS